MSEIHLQKYRDLFGNKDEVVATQLEPLGTGMSVDDRISQIETIKTWLAPRKPNLVDVEGIPLVFHTSIDDLPAFPGDWIIVGENYCYPTGSSEFYKRFEKVEDKVND